MTRSALGILALFSAALAAQEPLPAPKESPSPEGVYLVAGTTSAGADYDGVAIVERAGDGIYKVRWLVGDFATIGVGQLDGDTLSIGWIHETPKGASVGVTVLRRDGTGWRGHYATVGAKEKCPESWAFAKKFPGKV